GGQIVSIDTSDEIVVWPRTERAQIARPGFTGPLFRGRIVNVGDNGWRPFDHQPRTTRFREPLWPRSRHEEAGGTEAPHLLPPLFGTVEVVQFADQVRRGRELFATLDRGPGILSQELRSLRYNLVESAVKQRGRRIEMLLLSLEIGSRDAAGPLV